jgi:hypothetical protein
MQLSQYSHYSLLATVEAIFNQGTLGRNDTSATPCNPAVTASSRCSARQWRTRIIRSARYMPPSGCRRFAMLLDASNVNWNGLSIRKGRFLVSSLIVMTIDDLEALESSTQNFGICELLRDYSAALPDRLDSLHNYIVADRKYGDAIIYSERVQKAFGAELKALSEKLGVE